ncbi:MULTISPECIES: hypothetical protein [unclassified Chryseobacterium]|uniref:hypothetical protein n=1 Tax=unclassified Chryseobacterium TaxID=2593645 RepID=UPI000F44A310|nr:hypothetical protein [Chryseobacterium sp. G0240]ROI04119.1 hypothetical protein EGI16_09985 [Chryseobacterium sp. G0240]
MKDSELKNELNLKGKKLTAEQLKTILGGISEFDCAHTYDYAYVSNYMNELRASYSEEEVINILREKLLGCGVKPL